MSTEVPKPTRAPSTKGFKLKEDPINFDGDCVDPMALVIITEALDYAVDASMRRLESVGKIISGIEEKGVPAVQVVQSVRDAMARLPVCKRKELTPDEEAMVAEAIRRAKEQMKEEKKEAPKLEKKAEEKPKPAAEKKEEEPPPAKTTAKKTTKVAVPGVEVDDIVVDKQGKRWQVLNTDDPSLLRVKEPGGKGKTEISYIDRESVVSREKPKKKSPPSTPKSQKK